MFNTTFDHKQLAETPSPHGENLNDYLSHIGLLNKALSSETKTILRDLKERRIKHYQFRDIPILEDFPPTATEYIAVIPKSTFQSEGLIGAVALELGTLFNYRETSESLMYDVYPIKEHEYSRSFVNSKKMLSFHTDGSAHPQLSPDFVLLYCVRDDPNAANLFVDVDTLVDNLSPEILDLLSQPLFNHLVRQFPEQFLQKPILYGVGRNLTIRYDEDTTFGINPEALFAQKCLNEMLREVAVEIKNHSNSLLVLNNSASLHARTSFTPRYDGKDRWIKCAFVTSENVRAGSIISLEPQGSPGLTHQ
jgi:L-asparagine oxygenase